jgi:hypothetical protein
MVERYFEYLKLYEDGFWLLKTHPTRDFDFQEYLAGIDRQAFREGAVGRDPADRNLDFVHQTGRYSLAGDRLEFVHRHTPPTISPAEILRLPMALLEERIEQELRGNPAHEVRWALRVLSAERLASPSGAVYVFHPASAP